MKLLLASIVFFGISFNGMTQIMPSDCTAHDSILDKYREDAASLTLKRFFDTNSPYSDSIIIPTSYSDSILNALVAVYNLTNSPERDSVVDFLKIHVFKPISMSEFIIVADSTLPWMQNLSLGIFPTGQSILDSTVSNWGFSLYSYTASTWQPQAYAHFITNDNYNLSPIVDSIVTIPGVISAMPNIAYGDASTIYSEIFPTHVELTYRYAWGDCPSGCTAERLWKFNVYYDCSVEFMGSSGEALPLLTVCPEKSFPEILVYPNPFSEFIYIGGMMEDNNYCLLDGNGREVLSGTTQNGSINLKSILSGVYQLVLKTSEGTSVHRMIKL